jgi:hypothetical protein
MDRETIECLERQYHVSKKTVNDCVESLHFGYEVLSWELHMVTCFVIFNLTHLLLLFVHLYFHPH